MNYSAVIFDLDGVIVTTDDCHYRAWKKIADEEGIPFNRTMNERLRGVSRMESLEIILESSLKQYTIEQKEELCRKKNEIYRELVRELTPTDVLEGVQEFICFLRSKGIKTAIGSSSKNTEIILDRIGMADYFDAVSDGNHIKNSKPHPEVFLKAAEYLNIPPEQCLVIEDADAGVEAALKAKMHVAGVGSAQYNKHATYKANGLQEELFYNIF